MMVTKSVSSTEAKNNFGKVLEDVTHNFTRYIVNRHGVPQAIILSLDDFVQLLDNVQDHEQLSAIVRELKPDYQLGEVVSVEAEHTGV